MRNFPNLYGFANTYGNCRTLRFLSTVKKKRFIITGFYMSGYTASIQGKSDKVGGERGGEQF
jgi:hypothetical protein